MKRAPGPRKTANLADSVHRQVNMYALAASAAGVGMLALVPPAEAKIVFTPVHRVIESGGRYSIDFNHDGISDMSIFNSAFHSRGASINIVRALPNRSESGGVEGAPLGSWIGSFLFAALKRGKPIGYGPPFYYQKGVMIGQCAHGSHEDAPPCSFHPYHTLGSWGNVKNRYLGVIFMLRGKAHYGWARFTVQLSRKPFKATAIVTGFAYETIPGKRIIAGRTTGTGVDVEPATLGGLALGRR